MGHALYARRSRQANAQGFDLEGLLKHRLLLLLLLDHSALKSHPQNQLHNNDKVKADPFKKGYSCISIVPQDGIPERLLIGFFLHTTRVPWNFQIVCKVPMHHFS